MRVSVRWRRLLQESPGTPAKNPIAAASSLWRGYVLSWRNWAGTVVQDAVQDVRYALRWFRRDLTFTGAIVPTLAFGIGLKTGVFSVLSGLVFRSRVEKDSSSFFQVLATLPSQPDSPPRLFSNSVADLRAYRCAPGVASMAAWAVSSGRVQDDADPASSFAPRLRWSDHTPTAQNPRSPIAPASAC